MGRFDGKKVLVTGGTRGIGRACVEGFLAEGARVAFCGTTPDAVGNAARELGQNAKGLACDVSDPGAVSRMVGEAAAWLGGLDALVCNAGVSGDGLLPRMKDRDWDAVLRTNLNGVFFCCRAASEIMIRQRSGRIVNVSSVLGLHGQGGMSSYCASKGGVIAFTKSIAQELARRNITANVVAPGLTRTDMTAPMSEENIRLLESRIPLGRAALPGEIAKAVLFLASDDASFITGEVLCVDGGLAM